MCACHCKTYKLKPSQLPNTCCDHFPPFTSGNQTWQWTNKSGFPSGCKPPLPCLINKGSAKLLYSNPALCLLKPCPDLGMGQKGQNPRDFSKPIPGMLNIMLKNCYLASKYQKFLHMYKYIYICVYNTTTK